MRSTIRGCPFCVPHRQSTNSPVDIAFRKIANRQIEKKRFRFFAPKHFNEITNNSLLDSILAKSMMYKISAYEVSTSCHGRQGVRQVRFAGHVKNHAVHGGDPVAHLANHLGAVECPLKHLA